MTDDHPHCPKCGYGQPWGIHIQDTTDGILIWDCPSCNHRWPKYPDGTALHKRGLKAIAERSV